MAFTVNKEMSVFGNKRVVLISCSVDSASGNVDTGLSVIDGFSLSVVSGVSAGITARQNVGSGATARNGILNINSATSGDSMFIVVFGR